MLGVAADECSAANSMVTHASGRSVAYADIVSSGDISRVFTEDELKALPLKSFGEYKLVGQSVQQLDIPAKTDGERAVRHRCFRAEHDLREAGDAARRATAPCPQSVGRQRRGETSTATSRTMLVADTTGVQKGYAIALGETYWGGGTRGGGGGERGVGRRPERRRVDGDHPGPRSRAGGRTRKRASHGCSRATPTPASPRRRRPTKAEYITNLTYHRDHGADELRRHDAGRG